MEAATKQYVDTQVSGVPIGDYLPIAGGTMEGVLVLDDDPENDMEAATKQYVDDTTDDYLPLAGGTLTGHLTITGGKNIVLSETTGTKIGTATTQLLGFYNKTPVNQPDTITDPSGGLNVDAEARTAINATIDRLQELGLIA
jgi:phage-related tail fiber protein